ncbi:C10 family peptidase [Aureivirga marina]|uniref:C10 family peptidase n=1 Tax=Aureivirga marina TaxID=1182451 RepID=UPI0018C9D510|nr:C10 family peptidase [Aureivirga marina]
MIKLNLIKKLFLIFAVGFLLTSCNKEENSDLNQKDFQDENVLSESSAKNFANHLLFGDGTAADSNARVVKRKIVESVFGVPDANDLPAYYIVNYRNGGFVILSGDRRTEPILAFSETNSFDLDQKEYPGGLVTWLYDTKVNIEDIRKKDERPSEFVEKMWSNLEKGEMDVLLNQSNVKERNTSAGCTPYNIQRGPYIQTTWGQSCGYNSLTPSNTCGPCDHYYTGCVATAMAQIMKYHQYPSNYNWSGMPNSYGTTSTATLMADIGDAVNMNYGCDGSSADTKGEAPSSFKDDFNYSSADYADYNITKVTNELNVSRPMILKGGKNTGWWIFGIYSGGHAWVCDGYLNYIDPCGSNSLKLRMNWGWSGSYDGWYSSDNFNPGTRTYNYKRGMVYNIRP